jgi:hypothetical protein
MDQTKQNHIHSQKYYNTKLLLKIHNKKYISRVIKAFNNFTPVWNIPLNYNFFDIDFDIISHSDSITIAQMFFVH